MLAMALASCSSESIEADVVSGEKLVVGTTIDVSGSASADRDLPHTFYSSSKRLCTWRRL